MPANYDQPDYIDKRLRYFDGQFLKDQDFIDEQKYHVDRTRRIARMLKVSGVSEGLVVTAQGVDRVAVDPGTAVDSIGRLIVQPTQASVSVANYRNQTAILVISYQQIESDPAQQGSEGNRRWQEVPLIQVITGGTDAPARSIILAKLNIDKDGIVIVDNSTRQYSGIYLPAGSGRGIALRGDGDTASNRLILTGDLSVSGSLQANTLSVGAGGITTSSATLSGDLSFGTTTKQMINLLPPSYGIGVQSNTEYFRTVQNFAWYKGGSHNDAALNPGGGTLQMAIVDGNVGIGTASPSYKLAVSASANHLQVRRERTETVGGKLLFLELYQDDPSNTIPESSISLRFQHNNKYSHRIEARSSGFHFKDGDLNNDSYRDIYAGRIACQNVRAQVVNTDAISTTSTAWVDMPNMTLTVTTGNNPVLILFKIGGVQTSAGRMPNSPGLNRAKFRLLIDDVQKAFSWEEFNFNNTGVVGWNLRGVTFNWVETLSAGQHTIKVQWSTDAESGGTVNGCVYQSSRTLQVVEL